jgi:hypothetical protein
MSGLFTSLADRVRGETRAVRPRLPARFETSAQDIVEFAVETSATSPSQPAATGPTSATAAWTVEADHDAPPLDAPTTTADLTGAPTGTRPTSRPAADPAPTGRASSRAGLNPDSIPTADQRATSPPLGTDQPERHPRPPLAPQIRLREPQGIAHEPDEARSPAPIAAESRPAVPAPRRELAPRLALARPPASPRPPDETAREETTVHVSIGRIELRAARSEPPPAPKPRAPATPPVMSLDDYLRSRRARP